MKKLNFVKSFQKRSKKFDTQKVNFMVDNKKQN